MQTPSFRAADFQQRRLRLPQGRRRKQGTVYYFGFGITGRSADIEMYQRCMLTANYTISPAQ
jgi:hypothetical protein